MARKHLTTDQTATIQSLKYPVMLSTANGVIKAKESAGVEIEYLNNMPLNTVLFGRDSE